MTTHVPQSVELVLALSVDCNVELVVRQQYLSTAAEELDVEDVDSPPTAVCKQAEGGDARVSASTVLGGRLSLATDNIDTQRSAKGLISRPSAIDQLNHIHFCNASLPPCE